MVLEYKYLYAIIRKPQEGKTFICINNIKQNPKTIHIIFTMNTIKSNKQFFQRTSEIFGDKLIILNSEKSSEACHANNLMEVAINLINGTKEILIMCCHKVRFTKSLQILIEILKRTENGKSIMIHIDEAHKYIPSYRDTLYKINNLAIVERVYCYSATPFNIWKSDNHILYQKIYVVDILQQFNISETSKYFGVKDVELLVIENPGDKPFTQLVQIDKKIPGFIIKNWALKNKLKQDGVSKDWYCQTHTYFDLGHEYEYLAFLKYSLEWLIKKDMLSNNAFSYNFFPGYTRIVTHFGIMNLILKTLTNALVIVFNGKVQSVFLYDNSTDRKLKMEVLKDKNEPSQQIQHIINKYPNRPTFITGHLCIGMSVTLINETIGNFDNVLFSFPQYHKQHDVLYQMCRFMFNYISWNKENQDAIKKTRFITDDITNYQICKNYETQIEKINNEMQGSVRTLDEVKGSINVKESKKPTERRNDEIMAYHKSGRKMFKVYDGNDLLEWEKVKRFWHEFKGKSLSGKSMLKLDTYGFYQCSTTNNVEKHDLQDLKKSLDRFKWDSNFQLAKNTYNYIRLYVGYENINDNSEYTIFIRYMVLEENERVERFLKT